MWNGPQLAEEIRTWGARFIEASIDPLILLDRHGCIEELNAAARTDLRLGVDYAGKIIWHIFPDLVGGHFWHRFHEALDHVQPVEDSSLDVRSPHWIRYRIQPIVDRGGGLLCIAVSWKVTTKERLLEASLSDTDSKLEFVMSVGRVVHYSSDLVTGLLHFSNNGPRIFGRSSTTGNDFLTRVHPDDLPKINEMRRLAVHANGEPAEVDFRYAHPDGRQLSVRIRAVHVPRRAGRNAMISGLCILLDENDAPSTVGEQDEDVVTGAQLRGARGILGWSVRELADRSGVSMSTIARAEDEMGNASARPGNLASLKRALQEAGIRFFLDEDGRPAMSLDRGQIAGR